MGNHMIVMNEQRQQIGSMNLSLDCFAVVNQIAKKYTGEYLPFFGDINAALEPVYSQCEQHEEIMLLVFLNDKSTFEKQDIPNFDKALSNWEIENENPKKFLEFIRDMLKAHDKVITEYSGVSTTSFAVTQ